MSTVAMQPHARLCATKMAERGSFRKTTASISQAKKPPFSPKMAGRSKRCETRPRVHSGTPGPTTKPGDDLFAKEEHYKLLNAELEAKTTDLVRQAEQLIKEQSDVLSKPLSTVQLTDLEDDEDARLLMPSQNKTGQKLHVKVKTKQMATPKNMNMEKQLKEKTITSKMSCGDDLTPLEESADSFLVKTIKNMEENMDDTCTERADTPFLGEITAPCISDAQIRVLKAKLQIMQEELDQQTSQYYKKDDENIRLNAKLKELEEDRARLQRSQSIQQTQIEKYKALAEQSVKRCEGLQLQVVTLNKEIENLNRSTKQAAAVHNTVEIRLNRALEESQRLKTELNKIKQISKDKVSEEHQSKENLLAENKTLRKQKAELIVGFKKQLKLIDILKQQKMHLEASKLLSFTEEEFMKALDWGKS